MPVQSYKELIVWQKSMALVKEVYAITSTYPKQEIFGLISQMRRSAISIPSNIAEGRGRGTRKDFAQFLCIARGSAIELETQIEIARSLSYGEQVGYNKTSESLTEVIKMLSSIIGKLKTSIPST
jgi:four helix bundle protein